MIYLFDDFGGFEDGDYAGLLERAGDRRGKILSYRYCEDRILSAAASAMIRLMTGGAAVSIGAFGKPYASGCAFNISHCRMCVAGVSIPGESGVGIDVEAVFPDFDREILPLCFTRFERRQIEASREQADMFHKLWTLKESYVKAIGTGVRDLLSVEFGASGELPECSDARFVFRTFRHGEYRVSACVEQHDRSALADIKYISQEELRHV